MKAHGKLAELGCERMRRIEGAHPSLAFGALNLNQSLAAFVLLALAQLAFAAAPAEAQNKPLQLEEIFSKHGLTGPAPTQLRWSPNGQMLSYILEQPNGDRDLWAFEPATGNKKILVTHSELQKLAPATEQATNDERERERRLRYSVAAYLWSPDSKSVLFTSAGQLYLYNLAAQRARPIAPGKTAVRFPKFSPNGRWISFVYQHDIWLAPSSGGEERRLTHGATENLFHGDLDWVYPEEFGVRSAYFWSPDSRRIAFLELDQSSVPAYPIPDLLSLKPSVDMQRYPKAGDPNPRVRVGIVEAKPGTRRKPRMVWVKHRAEYVPRIAWANDDTVAVQFMNRPQTELELIFADAGDGRVREILTERDPHWVNVADDLTFLDDSDEFLWTSEQTGFRHIYLYSFNGQIKKTLTQGEWEVGSIEGVDRESGWVYYTSKEHNPLGSDLYRVKLDGGAKPERLTSDKGTHRVSMDSKARSLANTYSGLMTVPKLSVQHMPSGRHTLVHDASSVDGFGLVKPELSELTSADGALIRLMLMKPKRLDANRKYPLLVYVYGGPRAPTIRDAWGSRGRFLFHQYLVQEGYVVAYVDDRASSILGHRYESALARNYGPAAVTDYETAVEHLKSLDFIDPEKIAIWGWSGGGFSTCLALTHSKLFKLGIAVAPVTDWRLYDSIYTERYMGHPEEEPKAYQKTSAVAAAKNLHGRLLLIHGTSDDNVHVQNTMQMVDALIAAGKPYDLQLYPGKTHSVHGEKARLHLFRGIEKYLEQHLH